MLKIRLARGGRKKHPFYRVVVTNSRNRRDGQPVAFLGYYNPMSKDLKLDKAQALDWVSKGAQTSEKVAWLLEKAPESGELIRLDLSKKERLSLKQKARQEAEEKAKADAAEAAKKAAEEAAAAAAEAPAEEPAATEEAAE